ncbi:MAG: hypothetical protein QM724_00290 [Flavobacteriales bacterium]
MRKFLSRYPVATFITLTLLAQFGVVLTTWYLIPPGQKMHSDSPGAHVAHMVFRFRVFFPLGIAMLLTLYLDGWAGIRKLFSSFLHWRVAPKWYALAFVWKFFLGYLGIFGVIALGLDVWPGWINHDWFPNLITNFAFLIGIALVEETSWIRFTVTRLQERHSALFASTVAGLGWAAWYLMMMMIGEGVPDGIPWFAFIISMFSMSVFFTWTYNTTRSGTVLLVMQFFSNSAFLIVPMLPVPNKPPYFMVAFVLLFLVLAVAVTIQGGAAQLNRNGSKAKWSDPVDDEEDEGSAEVATEPVPVRAR